MVIALLVFSLFASDALVRAARGLPLEGPTGVARQYVLLPAATGVDRLANALSLNRPYDWAREMLGKADAVDEGFEFPTATTVPPETEEPLPPVRVPTVADPLRVLVAGDSTAHGLGDVMAADLQDRDDLAINREGTPATGLARRDFMDWGLRLQQLLESGDPEVVVFMVGANDNQTLTDPAGRAVADRGTPEWEAEYGRRVAGIMDLVEGDGRRLIWVGQPGVRAPGLDGALARMNELAAAAATERRWVEYVDTRAIVAGPGGGYADYLTLPDGRTVQCRHGDGTHLTVACLQPVVARVTGNPPGIVPPASGDVATAGE